MAENTTSPAGKQQEPFPPWWQHSQLGPQLAQPQGPGSLALFQKKNMPQWVATPVALLPTSWGTPNQPETFQEDLK